MDYLGSRTHKRSRLRSALLFFGTAAITGVIVNLLLFRFYYPQHSTVIVDGPSHNEGQCTPITGPSSTPGPPLKSSVHWQPSDKSLDELRAMVATTKGYYGRDWSLGLGWNNMRYIVEASLLQAKLLNRTLVLPSFVYARACEYEIHSCAAFSRMVNRGDALGLNQWRNLPIEQQMGWRIPIDIFFDLAHLRSEHPVVLVSEYLQLHNISIQHEWSNGAWHTEEYHKGTGPSLRIIENSEYDPFPVVRVDTYESKPQPELSELGLQIDDLLRDRLQRGDGRTLRLAETRQILASIQDFSNDTTLYSALEEAGWTVLHTWNGVLGMDYVKWVVEPLKEVAPKGLLRGFVQQFGHFEEDVVVLKGEIHLHRKPGFMRFTSQEAAVNFARIVLHDLRITPAVRNLALRMIERIDYINEGRIWQAAHMRRGDFVSEGWVMEKTMKAHFERVKSRLDKGRDTLEYLHAVSLETYDVPNVEINEMIHQRMPPQVDDAIYIATDERMAPHLDYLRNNNVILFQDILTINDRRDFGWPIIYTDVVACVEQAIMGLGAGYFYGHALSSVVGGVVNIRATAGMDPRTVLVD